MEQVGTTCIGRLWLVWGLYALAVVGLSSFVQAAGWPEGLAWAGALALGYCALLWTREL